VGLACLALSCATKIVGSILVQCSS
jgi:hypothetical protein